jgi:Grx4 family monothiol glutaredoxin
LYGAEWLAEQCNQILAVMEQLTKQDAYKSIKFLNVAIEEIPEVAQQHEIEAVPTVIFFQNNKAVHRIDGIDIADFTATIKKLAGASAEAAAASTSGSLEDRLKALINKAKVMVFVKGDRNTPKCGFSKQLIQILNDTKVAYETFDILTDEEVRQGLKTYSDWPTYPQVYVNGELQGGLDIIKEMVTSGELVNVLQS